MTKLHDDISAAELQTLQAIADHGRTAIAAEVSRRSVETIKSQLKSIYLKLGVISAAQAVAEGFRRGLLK